MTQSSNATLQTTTLGGGCFWCLDAVYRGVEGVHEVIAGYAGGHDAAPTYASVCSGTTGHAEVVRVTFDPTVLTFDDVLGVFFATHDPTTLNRQGADIGTQYRSIVLAENDAQAEAARSKIAQLDADEVFGGPIVTQVEPLDVFYPAEAYHQNFFANNPGQGYCAAVIAPKVAKFRAGYAHLLKPNLAEAGRG